MKDWSFSAKRPHICFPGLSISWFGNVLETEVEGREGAGIKTVQEDELMESVGF